MATVNGMKANATGASTSGAGGAIGRVFKPRQRRKAIRLLVIYPLASLAALVSLLPIIWMVKTSFESPEFVFSSRIQFWPIEFTLQNYQNVLSNPFAMIGRSTLNTVIVATLSTLLSIAITATAGYAMSRFEFRGKVLFGMYLLLFYMIPRTLLLIGMFVMLAKLGLINSHMGLVLTYAALGIPLATWWLKGCFDAIPLEIEEQGMIDGCNRLGALWRLVVPLALPGIAAVAMFQFIEAWNEFMMALTIIQSNELMLLSVRIVNFLSYQRIDWGPVTAFSVMVALPAVILFAFMQRSMVAGLMAGFTK